MVNIAIIGLGLIGGSIAKAIKQQAADSFIAAFDFPETLQNAINEGVIDKKLSEIHEAKDYSVIFICLPVEKSIEALKELGPKINSDTIITDVCSIKGKIADAWSQTESAGTYIGGHPMTGKEVGGYSNSDSLLFENSTYIIDAQAKKLTNADKLFSIIKLLGSKIYFVDCALHDEIVANVSHLPQMLSVALVNSSSKISNGIKFTDFAAGGFRDMTRIASSDYKLWESIVRNNKTEILNAISCFSERLNEYAQFVKNDMHNELYSIFEEARFSRDEIPKDTKGFISPLFDLFIFVNDEPGIISKISTALFSENINIKDIELLKIREGTGGTFRISFDSIQEAEEAKLILEEKGFRTKF